MISPGVTRLHPIGMIDLSLGRASRIFHPSIRREYAFVFKIVFPSRVPRYDGGEWRRMQERYPHIVQITSICQLLRVINIDVHIFHSTLSHSSVEPAHTHTRALTLVFLPAPRCTEFYLIFSGSQQRVSGAVVTPFDHNRALTIIQLFRSLLYHV